jgi:Glycosyl transferase family 2
VDGSVTIDRPRVSAIVTTYNAAQDIRDLSQRLAAMPVVDEIVIYDDASSDGTPSLLADYAAEDSRIKLILGSANKGVAAARNEALTHCRGEYVWFADPDDQWSPRLVEVLHQALEETEADIAVCRAEQRPVGGHTTYVIDGIDRWATRDRLGTLEFVLTGAMRGYLWNKLFRRDVMPMSPFPPMRSQSDFVGLMSVLGRSESTVFVPDVLYTRVERPGSITRIAEGQVENLRRCLSTVESILADQCGREQYGELFRYFAVWFFAIPAANTPLRTRADRQAVDHGVRSAVDVLKQMSARDHLGVAGRAPRFELQVMCLLALRGAYPSAYRAAKALRARLPVKKR